MNNIISNKDTETWINYIITNYKQGLLLFMVVLIIYSVEYIAYINSIFYGRLSMPSIPGIPNSSQISTKKKLNRKR
jgi:hypothetical protein